MQHRKTGKLFVAEMKCELEFQNYKYLRLSGPWQLHHHSKTAFKKFLQIAVHPSLYRVKVGGREVQVHGAVLIWGAIDPRNRDAIIREYGFADILSVETMINDLRSWRPSHWVQRVEQLKQWSNELFEWLLHA
ncbi:MAG: hypothetical protein ACPLPR_02445 [Bacillota bacterium]